MAPTDLDDLLRGETSHVEWKKQAAEIEDVVRSLTAFANDLDSSGQGGWVVCGIEEAKDDHGFPTARRVGLAGSRFKEVQGTVLDWCRERVSPPILPSIEEVELPEDPSRRILVFHVEASGRVHAFQEKDGRTRSWVRHGSKTVVANKELLRQLQEKKGEVPPFLQRPCSKATLDDIDLPTAREFLIRADLPHPPDEYLRPGARLDAFSYPLVQLAGPRAVPTYLALLLFSREPTRWIPGAYTVLTVYPGIERMENHSVRFEATRPLPDLIRDLLERLQLHTGTSIDKSRSALEIQQNRPRYSAKALQEAIVNAFAHRDYESSEPVRITVFSDRMEIVSPGGYVYGMDPDRLRRGDATPLWRNPALASFLLKLQLAQNEGQGLKTILSETRARAGRNAQIIPGQTTFEVVIPAFRPVPSSSQAVKVGEISGQGLVLISVGGQSIRPTVEHSLPELGLAGAEVLVDFALPEYVSPDVQHWEAEAVKIRDQVRSWVENPRVSRMHLFYRGPVVIAPLLGALIAPAKPLVVYHYEDGRYAPAYTLDRRFLIGKD
jgi:ATP-dependent DNA helicase RecG